MGGATVSDCGKYVFITIFDGCDIKTKFYYADISGFASGDYSIKVNKIIDSFEA